MDRFENTVKLVKEEVQGRPDHQSILVNVSYLKDLVNGISKNEEKVEKKTIAKILAYVEKNYDVPEIEEYLWKILDEGTEME